MRRVMILVGGLIWVGLPACVTVRTPDVTVETGFAPRIERTASATPGERGPAYARPLRKVLGQPDRVAKEVNAGDWKEAADEAGDLVEYARVLSGYAGTTDRPNLFRQHCDQLLTATQRVRRAVQRQSVAASRAALDACDPILDQLVRDFPLVEGEGRGTPPRFSRASNDFGRGGRYAVSASAEDRTARADAYVP